MYDNLLNCAARHLAKGWTKRVGYNIMLGGKFNRGSSKYFKFKCIGHLIDLYIKLIKFLGSSTKCVTTYLTNLTTVIIYTPEEDLPCD